MNRTSIVALVIGAMLFGCGVGMVAHEAMEPEEAVAWEGQKWEYKCAEFGKWGTDIGKEKGVMSLNTNGAQGWELVQVGGTDATANIACFKRPLN